MLIQPCSSQPELARGTVVLLENSITMRVTEQHKRMEVITQQLEVPNSIEEGWYTNQRFPTAPRKNTPDHDLPSVSSSHNGNSSLHATRFQSSTLVPVLSCPGKTCIEQWYFRRSMAPKTHTDFPEVIDSIVIVKIPNPTDISLGWVPF
ncbi:hypothetical protein TNCV_1695431 [Trichonephila clavipes]|nr:hypothetical protein TNCV_1695431 [Trichonephila clavipes]